MEYTPSRLVFENNVVQNQTFQNNEFEELYPPGPGPVRILRNVDFISCRVRYATFIRHRVRLENVHFRNLVFPGPLEFSVEAIAREVKFSGSKPCRIIVKPLNVDTFQLPSEAAVSFFLDVSEYGGKVEVFGLPREKVVIDPERQLFIDGSLFDEVDWEQVGIGALSFFRIGSRLVANQSAVHGVFSIPKPRDRGFEEFCADRRRLEHLGYRFV